MATIILPEMHTPGVNALLRRVTKHPELEEHPLVVKLKKPGTTAQNYLRDVSLHPHKYITGLDIHDQNCAAAVEEIKKGYRSAETPADGDIREEILRDSL